MRRFLSTSTLLEWLPVNRSVSNANPAANNAVSSQAASSVSSGKPQTKLVTIVYDSAKHKLRAQANDGVHGTGNVAFPNYLRTHEGQQYEVDELIWNGKNYRVSGNITSINSTPNTQNMIETFFKENYTMNFSFQTALDELDKLYESLPATKAAEEPEASKKVIEEDSEKVTEACDKPLVEAGEEKEAQIEEESVIDVVDDEIVTEEEPEAVEELSKQAVLECSKCGALTIKDETDLEVDTETSLVNVEEVCQYCEAKEGYKNIGTFIPCESKQELEELFDLSLNLDGGTGNDVSVLGH